MVEKPKNEKGVAAQAVAAAVATHQERLQKIILSWDYSKLNADSQKFRSGKVAKKEMLLRRVGDTFKDVAEYLGVFEPLLLEEVKAQILRGEGEKDTGENVTEYQLAAVAACEKVNQFYSVSIAVKEDTSSDYQENDLLLLSEEKLQDGSNLSTYAFAMVERHDGKAILKLRMFFDGEVNDTNVEQFNQCTRLSKMLASLQPVNSFVWILKLSSLSTILREYSALRSVGSLPFSDIIFSAGKKHADISSGFQSWSIPKRLMDYLESNHNESQLQAIQACLSRSPIVLIQGPPGTGKTQTILGLIGAVLHATPALKQSRVGTHTVQSRKESGFKNKLDHWMMASPWLYGKNPRDAIMPIDGDDGFYPTTGNDFKPEIVAAKRKHRVHILVCAPSNSALDEIVLRLLNTGIRDENGQVYSPSVVRVGLKPHHSVQAASMDYLVEQRSNTMEKSSGQGGGSVRDRDSIRAAILDEAAIVCSTLSFSGSSVFGRMNRGFDVVIIDEAAQAVEPATLVPLSHGCKQVFLVGDPIQLPATVLSTKAEKFGYGVSLFKRFQQAGYPVQMLKTQYRMHPEIREFPSREFYSEALEDGEDVMHQTRRSWHEYRCFGPFSFFDIIGKETQPPGSGSWINVEEAEWIIVLFRYLASKYPDFSIGSEIAVISPYKQQVNLIRERLRELLGGEGARQIDVNTIDGFQGREKDVAIFSCVRANGRGSIGFVSDFRRMNVGITRARSSMLVVGSATTLMKDEHWSNLINSAKERDRYFKVSKPYQSFFNAENLSSMRATATTSQGKERDEPMDIVNMPVNDTAAAEPAGDQQEQNDDEMDADVGGDDDMDD